MLRLKRASAGSGKTYQLAKTFIKMLLSVKKSAQSPRTLRNPKALREALKSIMAVTFTVKATAEMKQRIVEKLADLASADQKEGKELAKIAYLEEFEKEFHATKDEIAYLAKDALRILLLHYSDFKVQTIDSFFQSVLHTFAYEASLDENFNMEIDTDFVTSVGFDTALDSIVSSGKNRIDRETLYWLRQMMQKGNSSSYWNVFARNENGRSLYSGLISEAKNLEKEDFQLKRHGVESYFASLGRPFREVVAEVDEANLSMWKDLYDKRKKAAEAFSAELQRCHLDIADISRNPKKALEESLEEYDEKNLAKINAPYRPKSLEGVKFLSGQGQARIGGLAAVYPDFNMSKINDLRSAYAEWLEAAWALKDAADDPAVSRGLYTWLAYKALLPQLMIVLEIADKKREYLEATNTLEISDTAHILSRIIGKDDTPFVYERMGSILSHYLIDEFQDTSYMQWKNLYPLLLESDSRDEENLIIGDAKQSIYRFRNADYRLITDVVGKAFPVVREYTSDAPPKNPEMENTNFRSKAKVVKFNNYVFENVVGINRKDGSPLFDDEIRKIYDGARQYIPPKTLMEDLGFVDITVYPSLSKDVKDEAESVGYSSLAEPGIAGLPERIISLIERGYDYKDIGILVNTHDQGHAIIKVISAYNSRHPDRQIPVISKENLLVASALSVKLVVHALEIAMKGPETVREIREKKSLGEVLDKPVDEDRLFELLGSLQSQALPSVIEAVIDKFVPAARRDEETPFLAAFQDAVIEYSASHNSDIGSFLKWWKRKSASLTINSPEESNGVKINTIHGAKGLEYKCVIIPVANISFVPSPVHKEWKWVRPDECVAKSGLLPPFLPVATASSLSKTAHAEVWDAYCREVALDELNKMYVGFTRAVNELYVYIPAPRINNNSAAMVMTELLGGGEIEVYGADPEPVEITTPQGLPEGSVEYRFGAPLTPGQVAAEKREKADETEVLTQYNVCSDRRLLQFQEANTLLQEIDAPEDDEETADPRADGTLKHRIMQMIVGKADLPRALRKIEVEGLAGSETVSQWGEELGKAIDSVEPYGWFADGVRVVNERTLLKRGERYRRPDRIVIKPDGNVDVIDFKFGKRRPEHVRQVKDYAGRIAATGKYSKVDGYIWYVAEGSVVKV